MKIRLLLLTLLLICASARAGTKASAFTTTNNLASTNIIPVIVAPNTAGGNMVITISNLLNVLEALPNWAVGAGSGETNYNGEISVTNATRLGLVYGKGGVTNFLRSLSGSGMTLTNQGTNLVLYVYLNTDQFLFTNGIWTVANGAPFTNALFTTPAMSGLEANLRVLRVDGSGNITNVHSTSPGVEYVHADGTTGTPVGAGDFVGPGSSTDNAIVRFDGATGKLGQNSSVTIGDDGAGSFPTNVTILGTNIANNVRLTGGQAASSLLRLDSNTNMAAATVGPGLAFNGTVLATSQTLTNLDGTGAITNVVSLSTSNITSKPITNSLTSGVLKLYGIEGSATVTVTPNGSNYVLAASSAAGNPQGPQISVQFASNGVFEGKSSFLFDPTNNLVELSPGASTSPAIMIYDSGSTFGMYFTPRVIQSTNGGLTLQAGDSTNGVTIVSTSGNVLPVTAGRQGLGSSSFPWRDISVLTLNISNIIQTGYSTKSVLSLTQSGTNLVADANLTDVFYQPLATTSGGLTNVNVTNLKIGQPVIVELWPTNGCNVQLWLEGAPFPASWCYQQRALVIPTNGPCKIWIERVSTTQTNIGQDTAGMDIAVTASQLAIVTNSAPSPGSISLAIVSGAAHTNMTHYKTLVMTNVPGLGTPAVQFKSSTNANAGLTFQINDGSLKTNIFQYDPETPAAGEVMRIHSVSGQTAIITNGTLYGAYRTIYVDAAAMVSNITAGATFSTEESIGAAVTTNKMIDSYVFDGATSNSVQFKVAMPLEWDLSTVKVKLWTWSTNNVAAMTNIWGIQATAIKEASVLTNITWGTEQQITNVVSSDGGKAHLTNPCQALTVGNTPAAAGNLVWFRVRRLPGDVNDNDVGQQKLLGAWIQYKEGTAAVSAW